MTPSLIRGSGEVYRPDVRLWNEIIDHLVKPVFDGTSGVADLRGALVDARVAAKGGADQVRLRQIVDEIKARAAASNGLPA